MQINQYYGDVENGSEFNVGTGDTTTTAGGTVNKAQQKPPVASLPPKVNPQAPDSASIHRRKTLERAGRSPNDSAIIEPRSVAQHPGTNGANREQRDSALAQLKLIVRQLERCGANMERMWRDEDTIKCDVRALKQIVKNFTDSLRVYRAYQTQEVHQQAAGNTVIVGLNEPMRAPSYRQRTSVN